MDSEPIDLVRVADRFFHRNLPSERGEVAVAHFHLHRLRFEPFALESRSHIVRLFAQAVAQHPPIRGIAQESVFTADALALVAKVERPIVFAESEPLQTGSPR